jgi:hypothetical protein
LDYSISGRAEEVGGKAVGVEGDVEGFADSEEEGRAGDFLLRVAGEFGGYAILDVSLGDGGFAFFLGDVDGVAEIAEDVWAAGVLWRCWG